MFKIEEYIICMSKAHRDIDLNIYVYIGWNVDFLVFGIIKKN